MRLEDIQEGKTYHNGNGLRRRVTSLKKLTLNGFDVFYIPISKSGKEGKEQSCWCSTFAAWAKGDVDDKNYVRVELKLTDAGKATFEHFIKDAGKTETEFIQDALEAYMLQQAEK